MYGKILNSFTAVPALSSPASATGANALNIFSVFCWCAVLKIHITITLYWGAL